MNIFPALISNIPTSFFVFEGIIWIIFLGLPAVYIWKFEILKWYLPLFVFVWWVVWYGSYREPQKLVVREFQIEIPTLPHLRIAVIADIHVGPYKKTDWVQKIVEKLNKLEDIDVLLISGDFVFGGAEKYVSELSPLKDLQIPQKFFTLGNHDHDIVEPRNTIQSEAVSTALRDLGLIELKNDRFFWEEKNMWIAGVDDNDLGYDDLGEAVGNVEQPFILLAHSPDIVDKMTNQANLIVSGHTHCGQIRLPWLGALPFTIPSHNGKKLERWWYPEKNIFLTCGVGEVGPRARLLNPPEIVVLEVN